MEKRIVLAVLCALTGVVSSAPPTGGLAVVAQEVTAAEQWRLAGFKAAAAARAAAAESARIDGLIAQARLTVAAAEKAAAERAAADQAATNARILEAQKGRFRELFIGTLSAHKGKLFTAGVSIAAILALIKMSKNKDIARLLTALMLKLDKPVHGIAQAIVLKTGAALAALHTASHALVATQTEGGYEAADLTCGAIADMLEEALRNLAEAYGIFE